MQISEGLRMNAPLLQCYAGSSIIDENGDKLFL